jgi:hypothetical protein
MYIYMQATKQNSFRSRYLYIIIKYTDCKSSVHLQIVDIHFINSIHDKLPYYNWVVVACAWGNVCVCCRQEATGDNLHRDWSTGEASKSQAEASKHVFLSAAGDGFLGKLI